MTKPKYDEEKKTYKSVFNILEDLDIYNDLDTPDKTQDVVNFVLDSHLTPEQKTKAESIRTAPEAAQKLFLLALQVQHYGKMSDFTSLITKDVVALIPDSKQKEELTKTIKQLQEIVNNQSPTLNRKARRKKFSLEPVFNKHRTNKESN